VSCHNNGPPELATVAGYPKALKGKCHFNASGIPCFSAVLLSRAHLHMAQRMDTSMTL
jgi:hypothetical protein